MDLIDKINDEKTGRALLYCFTKGYGSVPMNVYNIVLPLLTNEIFQEELKKETDFQKCVNACIQKDNDFVKKVTEKISEYEEMTSRFLAILLLNHELEFKIENGIMSGNCRVIEKYDLKMPYILGKMLQGKKYEEIIMMLKGDFKIVFLDRETLGSDIDCSCLNQYGNAIIYEQTEVDEVSKRIEDARIVITNKHILGPEQLKNATKLKLICVTATGVNNIDLEYCKLANIAVCNVKGYSTNAVAQHTFALLLDLYNKNHYYHNYIASGNYASSSMFTHLGHSFHELDNKVWGIVGMGDIGRKVANLAEAFGCQVQYYSTSGRNNQAQFKRVDFDTLLKTSDIITIHAPLNKQTEYLFDEEAFAKMKNSAYLINVGRGKIVKETALVDALKNHLIAGAGLDVFENEPIKADSKLLEIQDPTRLLMTPHIAWAPVETRNRVIEEVCLNIESFKKGSFRNRCN